MLAIVSKLFLRVKLDILRRWQWFLHKWEWISTDRWHDEMADEGFDAQQTRVSHKHLRTMWPSASAQPHWALVLIHKWVITIDLWIHSRHSPLTLASWWLSFSSGKWNSNSIHCTFRAEHFRGDNEQFTAFTAVVRMGASIKIMTPTRRTTMRKNSCWHKLDL